MLREIAIEMEIVGKGRPKFAYGHTYNPKKTSDAEKTIRSHWINEYGKNPTDKPVNLRVMTFRPIPKSRPKRITSEPDTYTPDADNILKLVADALNKVAYLDDRQIVYASVHKCDRRRSDHEIISIAVEERI